MDLLIYGAGGHGQVVAEAAAAAGWNVLGLVDDDPTRQRDTAWSVVGPEALDGSDTPIIVAIGDNVIRGRVMARLLSAGRRLASVVHPSAIVSGSAKIGMGTYLGPQVVINARAQIGAGVIVNTAAVVEHDCAIDDYAHLAPRVTLGGGVQVGAMTLVGIGAAVRPDIRIGERATVGVGAAVVADVPAGATVVGVPARVRSIASRPSAI